MNANESETKKNNRSAFTTEFIERTRIGEKLGLDRTKIVKPSKFEGKKTTESFDLDERVCEYIRRRESSIANRDNIVRAPYTSHATSRKRGIFTSSLEEILLTQPTLTKRLKEHLEKTLPATTSHGNAASLTVKYTGLFLATITYTHPDPALFEQITHMRETSPKTSEINATILEEFLQYTIAGGDTGNFKQILELIHKTTQGTPVNTFRHRSKEGYAYHDYSKVIDFLINANPSSKAEYARLARVLNGVENHLRYRYKKNIPPHLGEQVLDMIWDASQDIFGNTTRVLHSVQKLACMQLEDANYNLEKTRQDLDTTMQAIASQDLTDQLRLLEMIVKTAEKEPTTTSTIIKFAEAIEADPKLLDEYERLAKVVTKFNQNLLKECRSSYWNMFSGDVNHTSELLRGPEPESSENYSVLRRTHSNIGRLMYLHHEKTGKKEPAGRDVLDMISKASERSFGRDVAALHSVQRIACIQLEDTNYDLEKTRQTLDKTLQAVSTHDQTDQLRLLDIMIDTAGREQTTAENMIGFAESTETDPRLIDDYEKSIEALLKLNKGTPLKDRLSYWTALSKISDEHRELSAEESDSRRAVREAIMKHLPQSFAIHAMQISYEGKLHKLSRSDAISLIGMSRWADLLSAYRQGPKDSDALEGRLGRAQGIFDDQIEAISNYGLEKVTEIEEILIASSYHKRRLYLGAVAEVFDQAKYKNLRETLYPKLARHSQATSFLTEGEDSYLSRFLSATVCQDELDRTKLDTLLNNYFARSSQLLQGVANKPEREQTEIYDAWFSDLLDNPEYSHAIDVMKFGKLTTRIGSDRDSETGPCTIESVGQMLAKFASLFGRTAHSLHQNGPLEGSVRLPKPRNRTITLPEFVSTFESHDSNKKIYKMITSLQAAFSRFGFFEAEETSSTEEFFRQFPNPKYACRIWDVVNYTRAKGKISDSYTGLSDELEATCSTVRSDHEEVLLEGQDHHVALRSLENLAVFGFTPNSHIMQKMSEDALPHLSTISEKTNSEVLEIVTELYRLIDDAYTIPSDSDMESSAGTTTTYEELKDQTDAEYSGQQVFFFDECAGKRNVRVIVKPASGVVNNRAARIRQENAREIATIRRQLEIMKPARVVVEKNVYEGELDEDAHVEMMLELKAGMNPDTNVYRNRRINERDVAVLLSINQSRLLGAWSDDDTRLINYLRPVLVYAGEASNTLDDDIAIVGYTSRGPNEVFVNTFKQFGEEWNQDVDNRVGLCSPLYKSRTGAAYRYFAQMMAEQPGKRKIHLDVITELANDDQYEGIEAFEDVASAVRTERAKGVELFAICLDQNVSQQQLQQIYGDGHFKLIKNPSNLPNVVIDTYRTLTLH